MTKQQRYKARQRASAAEYIRGWKANVSNHHSCECGNRATVYRNGAWECARCKELEDLRAMAEARRLSCGFVASGMPEYRLAISV